jgi:cyclopropane-fatty-acyl-phospholipid synthase
VKAQALAFSPRGLANGLARNVVLRAGAAVKRGRLRLTLPDGSICDFGPGEDGPSAALRVVHGDFFRRVLLGGEIGLGEAYMDGLWETDDLTELLVLGIINRENAGPFLRRLNHLARFGSRRLHLRRRNTVAGSRENVHAHYDLSNALFALFLDETMTYSSAVFATPEQSLADAQRNKYETLCRKAGLGRGDQVLEIGCGWGGFAIHAAQHYGCRVRAATISREQLTLARERVAAAGVAGLVDVDFCDYRQADGKYDQIVSIEMLEAVGAEYFGAFFAKCDALLKPGGRLVLQTISVPERSFAGLRDGVNWMQKYIFPGGMLPSLAQIELAIKPTRLLITAVEDIAPHYVRTLRAWRERFNANLAAVRALGFDERFIRMWRYYLCAAEAGFATRSTGDLQIVFEKPAL